MVDVLVGTRNLNESSGYINLIKVTCHEILTNNEFVCVNAFLWSWLLS